jgi:hypothetical protein
MIVALVGLTELPTFEVLSVQFRHHHHLKLPEFGRRGARLLFRSNFAQFIGL